MKFLRLYRDADPGSGGGLPPSLADLDDPAKNPPPAVPPATPPDPANPTGLPPADPPPADPPETPVEGLDEKGELLPGYEKLEDGTIAKIADPNEPPAGDPVDEVDFWKQVDELSGDPIEVDFGDVDPMSAEGVVIRDRVLREKTVNEFDESLRQTYPRAYAYFLHTQAGGSDEEFFNTPAPSIPARDVFEQDLDIQASWIKRDLVNKGVDPDVAEATVDKYVKNNQLTDKALQLYDKQIESDQARLKQLEDKSKVQREAYNKNLDSLTTSIATTIVDGMNFRVPDAQRSAFNKYVLDQVQYDGEKFVIVQDTKDLPQVLNAMYLQFVKGDLKGLIERGAQTKAVQRLGQKVKADAAKSSGGSTHTQGAKALTLGEI